MSWQHLGRLGGNNIPASRNHGDVMRPPTQAELAAYVGWVGFINQAPSQSHVASPAEGTWRSWVDGANPAYGTFGSRYPPCRKSPWERKSVVEGEGGYVRVDYDGTRIIQKKNNKN